MQSSADYIKNFTCQRHPSEAIERVSLDSNVETSLRCIECILGDSEKTSKDSMMALSEFIDHAARQYQIIQRTSTFEKGAPPEELTNFLAQEEENIQKFCQHIEEEKQRAHASFETMIQEFIHLCHQKKTRISNELDKQLATLKFNYSYYKSKLDRYYNKDKENLEEFNPDKETLIRRMNRCQDINQAEVLIKNIKDDLQEAARDDDLEQKMYQIKEGLHSLAQILQKQSQSLPTTKFCDQIAIDASLNDFREDADFFMDEFTQVKSQIFELSFTDFICFDSKLIRSQEDKNLLKKWLTPSYKDFQLRLLYRGTRDGLYYETFQKKCYDHAPTLTIAKSNNGRIFGGYTDQTWNFTNGYKASKDSWLFSIDAKLQFPIKESASPYAIYTYANYGPTFGAGHDLHIYLPHKGQGAPTQSYSNLQTSYPMYGSKSAMKKLAKKNKTGQADTQTVLGGSNYFKTDEIEMYVVEKRNTAEPTPIITLEKLEFDSEIINPEQDLNLIKSWLGREKDHEIELIYRGSRDGFRSQDFHHNCDDKGPTLVLCKSQGFDQIFGGFTTKNWVKDNVYIEDEEAFLFSLTHSTKHSIVNKEHAIYCSRDFGPIFGAGYDLFICSESNFIPSSTSSLGVSYQVSENLQNGDSYLAGSADFYVDKIEVFTVKTTS